MFSTSRVPARRLRSAGAAAVAVAAAVSLAACSSSANSAEPAGGSSGGTSATSKTLPTVKMVFDWIPTTGDVPVLAAEKFGWFKDAGINVTTTAGGPSVSGSTLVSAGQQDIGIVPPTGVFSARANGAPLISVGLTQPTGPTGLVCNPDSGVKAGDPTSLDGKKVGFSDNANDAIMTKWFAANGVDASSVKHVQTGSDLSLMFAGQVDCQPNFLTLIPEQAKEHYGKDPVVFHTSDVGATGQTIVTNEKFMAAHKDEVQAFLTGYAKGMQWALKNVDAAVALVKADYPSYDEAQAKIELPALEKFWVNANTEKHGLLWFDQASLQPTYDVVKGTEWLSKDIDLSAAFSTAALPNPAIMP